MWAMWLNTTMHPPVSGIFSPSSQVRDVVLKTPDLTIGAPTLNAQPRLCRSLRTLTHDPSSFAGPGTGRDAPCVACRLLGRTAGGASRRDTIGLTGSG